MANFNVDQSGNLWIGAGVSDSFSTAQSDSNTKFYVESDGTIKAEEGSIGGVIIDSDGMQSSNYNASTNTGWRIDNSQGTVFAYDIELILKASNSANEDTIPGDGSRKIQIGNVPIYDYNGNLNLHPASGKSIIIHNGNPFIIKGETGSAQLRFEGAGSIGDFIFDLDFVSWSNAQLDNTRRYSNPTPFTFIREFYFENDNTVIFRANEQNADVEFFGDIGLPSGGKIYINGDDGGTGDVLKRTATGMEWGTLSSGISISGSGDISVSENNNAYTISHSDADHSFSASGHNHDTDYDNYEKWILKGNGNNLNVLPGYGVEFKAGSGISLSVNTSPYEITFSHGGGTHVSSSTAVQAIFVDGIGLRGSLSFTDGNGGKFWNGFSNPFGNTVQPDTTSTFNGTPTFSSINVNGNIQHSQSLDGSGLIGFSTNRFNRLYASNGVSTTSDERLKENIENIPYGLDYLNTLRPVQFEWIPKTQNVCSICNCIVLEGNDNCGNCWENVLDEDGLTTEKINCACEIISVDITGNKKLWGFIAQELINTPPEPDIDIELVDYDSEGDAYNMNYSQLIAPLVKAVQELSTQISDLTARVELLEG
jgi:hypothetical protein